jgi:hypothetical protein
MDGDAEAGGVCTAMGRWEHREPGGMGRLAAQVACCGGVAA